jgi:beta-lactam-binding protein with PASTA domain
MMKAHAKSTQHGISLIGLIFVAGVLAMTGVVAAQVFPTVLEFMAVEKAVQRASTGQSVVEIRNIFDKASAIDDIKSIEAKDLEITKEGDKVVVSFKYQREIHLVGPGYLTLKYQGRSK